MNAKIILYLALIVTAFVSSGCTTVSGIVGLNQKCIVIVKRGQIRSSNAIVALDLLEVKRGDSLEVLGSDLIEGEKWFNVRASDEDNTEGWIEGRNIITQDILEKSRQIAEEDKNVPSQSAGQLLNPSNIRWSPDRTNDNNIMFKLDKNAIFDIVGWKLVPRNDNDDTKDDKTKNVPNTNSAQANNRSAKPVKDQNAPMQMDDKYDVWYKVRLQPLDSPAPAGWIYGKQVELAVPSDIIFYRTGREFVAWSRLDGDVQTNVVTFSRGKDAAKDDKPGSWVVLERSNTLQENNGEQPDFDRILILGYDKFNQDHYKVYRSGNVKGYLPLIVTGSGESRAFSVRMKGEDGEAREIQFGTYKDKSGHLKVNVPTDIPKDDKREN
ncbi:MAG: hypothetical protein H7Z37_07500 [Pyrinomonadaceae bacterium]|nr:hypothetical protein [Pyrinomonadaceae bacterium]